MRSFFRRIFFLQLLLSLFGCVYSFSNLSSSPPAGIRTVTVEGLYDTSRYPIPHDAFWGNVQRAIAANGALRIVDRRSADAILRIHLSDFSGVPSGQINDYERDLRDPKIEEFGDDPPDFYKFRDLSLPRAFYPRSTYRVGARAQLWDLRTRKLILDRTYPLAREFDALRGGVDVTFNFLRYHEVEESMFEKMGEQLGSMIVSDLVYR